MTDFFLHRSPELRRWVLRILIVGVPVFFLRSSNDPFGVPKVSLLFIGVVLALVLRVGELVHHRESLSAFKAAAVPAAAVVTGLSIAWVFSGYRWWSLFGSYGRLQGLIPYIAVALFGLLVADAFAGRADEIARLFLWSAAIVGGYAVIQLVGLDPFEWSLFGAPTEAVSTTGNPNFTGGFLGISLPLAVGMMLSFPAERARLGRFVVVIVAGWLAARSQGGWAAGLAGCALVAGWHMKPRFGWAPLTGLVVAAGVALATAGVVVMNIAAPDSALAIDAFAARGGWWVAAGGMFTDSPIVGAGPDVFGIDGVRFRTLQDALTFNFDFANDPHSVPLAMLANSGLLGFAGWAFAIGWAFWTALRRSDDLLLVSFGAATFAYLVQSLVSIDEISLRVGLWTAIGGVVASKAMATQPSRPTGKKRPPKPVHSPPFALPVTIGAVVLAAAMLVGTGAFLLADTQVRHAQELMGSGRVEDAQDAFEDAFSLRDAPDYRGRLAIELTELALRDEGEERYYEAARANYTSYIEDVSYLFSIVSYGRLLDGWASRDGSGGDPEAVEVFERALAIDPLNPLIRAELAESLNHLGRFDEALEFLEPQLELVPESTTFVPYWSAVALAAAHAGDEELARRAIDIVLGLAPADTAAQEAEQVLER